MNIKFILKTLFIIAALAVLVILGRSNPGSVSLNMPPLKRPLMLEAGYMYYGFFGVGFLCGAILMSGGKKGGGAARSNKAQG